MTLQILFKDGRIKEYDLQQPEGRDLYWGVTAIGCVFTTINGEGLLIHPDSVQMMRQYKK